MDTETEVHHPLLSHSRGAGCTSRWATTARRWSSGWMAWRSTAGSPPRPSHPPHQPRLSRGLPRFHPLTLLPVAPSTRVRLFLCFAPSHSDVWAVWRWPGLRPAAPPRGVRRHHRGAVGHAPAVPHAVGSGGGCGAVGAGPHGRRGAAGMAWGGGRPAAVGTAPPGGPLRRTVCRGNSLPPISPRINP